MERKTSLHSIEINPQNNIREFVDNNLGLVMKYIVDNDDDFPFSCNNASHLFQLAIKSKTGFEVKICQGSRHDRVKNEICPYHVWLEYDDLIIDPTDFQFSVIDLWSLPLVRENMVLEPQSFQNLSQEEIEIQFMNNYIKKAKQRYLEKPNPKEKRFLELKELLKNGQIEPNNFIEELKQNYECKTFYSKSDPNFIYQQK